ncbi:MAG: UPF0489 family protein [Planctomycetota bacterium]
MRRAAILVLLSLAACGPAAPEIAVFEEHHEALAYWRAAVAAGDLTPGGVLVHLDAHEDMGVPDPESGELTVSNFIVPALREGIFSKVIWVAPPFLPQVPRVEERGGFRLHVVPFGMPLDLDGPVALDIDLDFFACENPHEGHEDVEITREEYEALLASRPVRMEGTFRDEGFETHSIVLARREGPYEWPIRIDRTTEVGTENVRYVRGCVCMGEYEGEFPVWRPTDAEWTALVRGVGAWLGEENWRPEVVTVARSAGSGFVPPDLVDRIERHVTEELALRTKP